MVEIKLSNLSPGFSTDELTVTQIGSILVKHNIEYPSNAKRPALLEIFNDNVLGNVTAISAAHSDDTPSDKGIISMPGVRRRSQVKHSKRNSSLGVRVAALASSRRPAEKTSRKGTKRNRGIILDGGHERARKACERCRVKKIKCDGESPCKQCKDKGLVCTAGSRKKTEYKQLPRGYAEVLENTQYALIATVQKLYTMVRNGESWDLGEPELNDRGLPVIHNIAEKLGCIRPSPDMPNTFPEDAEEFAEMQAQMFAGNMGDNGKHSDDSMSHQDRTERASSSDYSQMLWREQQQNSEQAQTRFPSESLDEYPQFGDHPLYQNEFIKPESITNPILMPVDSSIYSEFRSHAQSPAFCTDSPFSPWTGGNEILYPSHILDPGAMYIRQQPYKKPNHMARPNLINGFPASFNLPANASY